MIEITYTEVKKHKVVLNNRDWRGQIDPKKTPKKLLREHLGSTKGVKIIRKKEVKCERCGCAESLGDYHSFICLNCNSR